MGRWPPEPSRRKFIKRKCGILVKFVGEKGIVEYGSVAAEDLHSAMRDTSRP